MPFYRCYYHLVWATRNREAVITPDLERTLFTAITTKSEDLKCSVLAINGTADHIHVALNMPPTISIAEWVKLVKGVSSREVNAAYANLPFTFRWQGSYGVLTFGTKNLEYVATYIQRQKDHHAKGSVIPFLERDEDE